MAKLVPKEILSYHEADFGLSEPVKAFNEIKMRSFKGNQMHTYRLDGLSVCLCMDVDGFNAKKV